MKRLFSILTLLLVLSGCKRGDSIELWNDLKVGDDVYHFTLVEFRDEDQIVCTGDRNGYLVLMLTLADGTRVTRKHMLLCPEGYHAEYVLPQGAMQAILHGSDEHDGEYRGVGGRIAIERHEFKVTIEMNNLQLVHQDERGDTIGIDDGYLSFDLSFF